MWVGMLNSRMKKLLIVGAVDICLLAYLGLLLLGFLKFIGQPDEDSLYRPVIYKVERNIINDQSTLVNNKEFHYELDTEFGLTELVFNNSGSNAYLGTYDPWTYIYGCDEGTLSISFGIKDTKLYKVTFDEVYISDENGGSPRKLLHKEYTTSMNNGVGIFNYSTNEAKYIYSVSLTFYVKK